MGGPEGWDALEDGPGLARRMAALWDRAAGGRAVAVPGALSELPLGWVRAAFGPGRTAVLVDSALPLARGVGTMKLADTMAAADKARRYWAFSVVTLALGVVGKTFTVVLPNPHLVKSAGFDAWDAAAAQYEAWATADAGKVAVAKGLAGLRQIGMAD